MHNKILITFILQQVRNNCTHSEYIHTIINIS